MTTARAPSAVPKLPTHPAVRAVFALGAFGLVAALCFAGIGGVVGWSSSAAIVAATVAFSVYQLRAMRAVQLSNLAIERASRGKTDEAEDLFARVSPSVMGWGNIPRGIHYHRALIALGRGDTERAIRFATSAIELRRGLFTRAHEDAQTENARSVRALAHAASGHQAEAQADADEVARAPGATPPALARAALARAVLIARTKDLAALARFFAATDRRVFDALPSRERVLVRALRRFAHAGPTTAYREIARVDESTAAGRDAAWIARLAPGAEAFVVEAARPAQTEPARLPEPTPEALSQVKQSRGVRRRGGARLLALWALLIVMFLAIWQFLQPADPHASHATRAAPVATTDGTAPFVLAMPALFVVVFIALLMVNARRSGRAARILFAGSRDVACGDEARGVAALTRLSSASQPLTAASARAALANAAALHADWSAALAHCDDGIARVSANATMRAAASDVLLPELVGLRALALAGLGRAEEMTAELVGLAREFPTYPSGARAQLRARLVEAVRAGDLERAAAIARDRTLDLPLPSYEDMLADMVLAATEGAADADLEMMRGELRDDERLRGWIEAVAPGLSARLRGRAPAPSTLSETQSSPPLVDPA